MQDGTPFRQPWNLQLVEDTRMKKLISVLTLALMVASSAFAIVDDGTSSLGAYSDMNGDSNCFTVAANTPFNLYWIMANSDVQNLGGFEFAWRFEPTLTHFILATTLPAGALNIGTANNMIVGLGLGLITSEATVLATQQVMVLQTVAAAHITAGPATPDSIDGEAAYNDFNNPADIRVMNWATYDGVEVTRNAQGWLVPGLATLNGACPPPVASETATMGNIKALWN
jgi:hypothetical protein